MKPKQASTFASAVAILALAACSGSPAAQDGGNKPAPASSVTASPAPTASNSEVVFDEGAARAFEQESKAFDVALAALYAELGKAEPSLPAVRRLAADARLACLAFRDFVRDRSWPEGIDGAAADLGREMSKLARLYAQMSQADSAQAAIRVADQVTARYDRIPAARVADALNLR